MAESIKTALGGLGEPCRHPVPGSPNILFSRTRRSRLLSVNRWMAHVAADDSVNYILRNIRSVIANSLYVFRDHDQLECGKHD
jgi:hypothetical protein